MPSRKKLVHKELQEYIDAHELSQEEFGKLVGASQGLVWQWLNGVTSITKDYAKAIEEQTGIKRLKLLYPDEARAA